MDVPYIDNSDHHLCEKARRNLEAKIAYLEDAIVANQVMIQSANDRAIAAEAKLARVKAEVDVSGASRRRLQSMARRIHYILSDTAPPLAVVEETCFVEEGRMRTPFTSYDVPGYTRTVTVIVMERKEEK